MRFRPYALAFLKSQFQSGSTYYSVQLPDTGLRSLSSALGHDKALHRLEDMESGDDEGADCPHRLHALVDFAEAFVPHMPPENEKPEMLRNLCFFTVTRSVPAAVKFQRARVSRGSRGSLLFIEMF